MATLIRDEQAVKKPITDEKYRAIINESMMVLALTDDECARFLDVSRPTVTRWRNGTTAPHSVMRVVFCNMLDKEIKRRKRIRDRY